MMRDLLPWILLAALTGAWLLERDVERPVAAGVAAVSEAPASRPAAPPGDAGQVFAWADLVAQRAASGRAYLPFLTVPTLRAGAYALSAGAEDRQQPHDKDEVYYVVQGRARVKIADADYAVQPGSVIFVAARADHRFYDITEDLHLLVFFSEAAPEAAEE